MSLFLQSDSMVEGNDKVRLREVENLYICDDASANYQHYVETHIQTIASSPDIPTEKKAEIVYDNATEVLDEMFKNPEALGNNKRASNMVNGFVTIVFKDNFVIESLMKITAHDYYTHTHSINVSLYSLSLGVYLGLDEENLQILGIASLLHDLGKSEVDYKIINKNGKLTESEFNQMKKHPKAGYDIAIAIGIKDRRILTGIRDHHEKMDGRGYPFGIKKEKISLFARIIGTCDVFDALTTKRSYKDEMSSFQALSIMKNQMDTHLDMKMVNSLARMIAKK
jgi:HD-GYP domain-containing protein (c-di-GMP phosphodiesterase class II)